MPSEAGPDAAPERERRRTPVGTINVVDPHPLNRLYITWNRNADLMEDVRVRRALVAVNKHDEFTGQAATLELAEPEITEEHWSRRNGA